MAEEKEARNNRRRKKRRRRKYGCLFFTISLFLVLAGVVLSVTVLFHVKQITASGECIYPQEAVVEASGFTVGKNLITENTKKAKEKILSALPYVQTVTIKKKLPATISIQVTPATEKFAVTYDGGCYIISDRYKLLSSSQDAGQLIAVKGLDLSNAQPGTELMQTDAEHATLLDGIVQEINAQQAEGIMGINIADSMHILLNYQNRVEIKLGASSDLDYKLRFALQVLKNKIGQNETGSLDMTKSGEARFLPCTPQLQW